MSKLGPRGQALVDSLAPRVKKHREATEALLLEAARLADRLDDLDDVIDGKGVLDLLRFRLSDDEGKVAEVKFDSVMSEARQQQVAFSGLMKIIMPNLDEHEAAAGGESDADEIAARRAARRSGASPSPRAKRQG